MKTIQIHKADPIVSDAPIDGVIISIAPELPNIRSLSEAKNLHEEDALKMFNALVNNLPQGTRYELVKLLINDGANLYRGI